MDNTKRFFVNVASIVVGGAIVFFAYDYMRLRTISPSSNSSVDLESWMSLSGSQKAELLGGEGLEKYRFLRSLENQRESNVEKGNERHHREERREPSYRREEGREYGYSDVPEKIKEDEEPKEKEKKLDY